MCCYCASISHVTSVPQCLLLHQPVWGSKPIGGVKSQCLDIKKIIFCKGLHHLNRSNSAPVWEYSFTSSRDVKHIHHFTKVLIVLLWAGAQEPALHAGVEESLLPHGGVQEEICRSVPSCGNSQGCLQVQWVAAGKLLSTIPCLTYWHSLNLVQELFRRTSLFQTGERLTPRYCVSISC